MQFIDLNGEFMMNDDKCEESLLDIKKSFPEVRRNTSTYRAKKGGVYFDFSLYQVDAISWLILSSEDLFHLKNWTDFSPSEQQVFSDSYYFISENFWKSYLFDFDRDRLFVPALYESLIKRHAVWTIGSFSLQTLVFAAVGLLLVLQTVKLFRKINDSFTIFGRLPPSLVQSINSRAGLFKIRHLQREAPEPEHKCIEEYYLEKDSWEEGSSHRRRPDVQPDSDRLLPELQEVVQEAVSDEGVTPLQYFKSNKFSSSSRIFFGQSPIAQTSESAVLVPPTHSSFRIGQPGDNLKLQKKNTRILFGHTGGSSRPLATDTATERQEETERSEQLEQPTKRRCLSMVKRLGCSGLLMFPTQIAIVWMDYSIYREYRLEAQFVNTNMQMRTSLHYLNSLNFEMITSAQVPFGRVATSSSETNLIEHFLRTSDETAAYYMGLDLTRFPQYLRPVLDRFDRYSQADVCALGGISPISYLASRTRH